MHGSVSERLWWRALARLLFAAALAFVAAVPAHAQKRVALVLGNSRYESAPLSSPAADVKNLGDALKAAGFRVLTGSDANQMEMRRLVREFGAVSQDAELSFFYYSGHGIQVEGENYLIPINAAITRTADVAMEAIPASAIVDQVVAARPKAAIFVLDACRDNPLAIRMGSKSQRKGLAPMYGATGTMIAFATAPNTTAPDDGTYARILASQLTKPGQELYDVFRSTSAEVFRISRGLQEPRVSDISITQKIYLIATSRAEAMAATGRAEGETAAAPPSQVSLPPLAPSRYSRKIGPQVTIELLGISDRRFTNNVGFSDGALIATFAVRNEGTDPIAIGLGSREAFCADFRLTDGRGGYCPACANGEVLSSLPAVRSGDNADRLTTVAAQGTAQHVLNFHASRCRSRIADTGKLSLEGTFLMTKNGSLTVAPVSFSDVTATRP